MYHVTDEVWEHIERPPIIDVRSKVDLQLAVRQLVEDPSYLQSVREASVAWVYA